MDPRNNRCVLVKANGDKKKKEKKKENKRKKRYEVEQRKHFAI